MKNTLEKINNRLDDTEEWVSDLEDRILFGHVSSDKGNKSRNKQMGLHQTKKLLHIQENYRQSKKATY